MAHGTGDDPIDMGYMSLPLELQQGLEAAARRQAKPRPGQFLSIRHALSHIDVIRHDYLVEESIEQDEAWRQITEIIDAYLDDWEGGHW